MLQTVACLRWFLYYTTVDNNTIKHRKKFTYRELIIFSLIYIDINEFLVLLEEQQREKVEAYIQNLTQFVEEYNNRDLYFSKIQ